MGLMAAWWERADFFFCLVDFVDGGQHLFFWVSLLQCLEDLGRFESRIGELLHFLKRFIVKFSVDDMGSWIRQGRVIVTRIQDQEFPNSFFLLKVQRARERAANQTSELKIIV